MHDHKSKNRFLSPKMRQNETYPLSPISLIRCERYAGRFQETGNSLMNSAFGAGVARVARYPYGVILGFFHTNKESLYSDDIPRYPRYPRQNLGLLHEFGTLAQMTSHNARTLKELSKSTPTAPADPALAACSVVSKGGER